MEILFLSRWFPYPPDNGAKIRIYNLLRELSTRHTIDLISFHEEAVSADQAAKLSAICRRVESLPYRSFQPGGRRALTGFLSWQPRSVVDTYSAEFERRAQMAARERHYNLVIASQIDMVPYAARLPIARRVAEEIELTTLFDRAFTSDGVLRRLRGQLTWAKYGAYLRRMLANFQGCSVVSERERARLLPFFVSHRPLVVIPNGVDIERLTGSFGTPESDTLIYNGALTYEANFDAVAFFLANVFPLIRAQRPAARLLVTGKTAGVDLARLPTIDGVVFTGYLQDVRPIVASAWASVVPLRVGGGTRLKILESMALGTPVVATTKGAEGLETEPGKNILLADRPEEFADLVLRLMDDPGLRARISAGGKALVKEKYDWRRIGKTMNDFLDTIAALESQR